MATIYCLYDSGKKSIWRSSGISYLQDFKKMPGFSKAVLSFSCKVNIKISILYNRFLLTDFLASWSWIETKDPLLANLWNRNKQGYNRSYLEYTVQTLNILSITWYIDIIVPVKVQSLCIKWRKVVKSKRK